MLYAMRDKSGAMDPISEGTWVKADGTSERLLPGSFSIAKIGQWHSSKSGATYPAGWHIVECRSHVWYSRPGSDDVVGRDFDSAGRVDVASMSALGVQPASHFYLCGPPSFLSDMRAALIAWGVAGDRIISEIFGSGPAFTPGVVGATAVLPHLPPGLPGTGPNVSFARSGIVAPWSAKYRSLLEFAEACDVPVRWSCRAGVCHTCESGLISGDVAYDPAPLDAPEHGNLLLCCASPAGEVSLDL